LTDVTIPENITSIKIGAFFNCTGLKTITIPSKVTEMGSAVLKNCSSLESLHCKAGTPPRITDDTLYGDDKLQAIYVPAGSVDLYKQTSGWNAVADKIKSF
jgi:hypothetical protein